MLVKKYDCVTPERVASVTISCCANAVDAQSHCDKVASEKIVVAVIMAARMAWSKAISEIILILHRLPRRIDVDAETVLALPVGVFRHL